MSFRRICLVILSILGSTAASCMLIAANEASAVPKMEGLESTLISKPADNRALVSFPWEVEGTSLVIEALVSYDGPFYEDGSGRECVNIVAVLLKNTGDHGVLETNIELISRSETLCFIAEDIPAGERVLVLETDGKPYAQYEFCDCSAREKVASDPWIPYMDIRVEGLGMDTLAVTNLTGHTLTQVEIFYKARYAADAFCLGGRSYVTEIETLNAGETVILKPEWFAGPYSQVLRVSFQKQVNSPP